MANKKKQVKNVRWKASYLWLLPLIATGLAVWQLGILLLWPALLWAILAYYTIAVIRGDKSALLSLAYMYGILTLASSMTLAVATTFWNLYGDVELSDLLWPAVVLNIPILITMLAYFCYRREFGWLIPGEQRLSAKVFDVIMLGLVGLNLLAPFVSHVSASAGPLVAIVAVYFAVFGAVRKSWFGTFVAFCFFAFAFGITVKDMVDVGNIEAKSILSSLYAVWNLAIVFLTFAVARTLFNKEKVSPQSKRLETRAERLMKNIAAVVCAAPLLSPSYFYFFDQGSNYYDETLLGMYAQIAPWAFLTVFCLTLYYALRYRAQKRVLKDARFDMQMLAFWSLVTFVVASYWSLIGYDPYVFPSPSNLFLLTMIAPLVVILPRRLSRIGLRIITVIVPIAVACCVYGMWSAISPRNDNVWAIVIPIILGCLMNVFVIIILWKREKLPDMMTQGKRLRK
jgi:hypothetical protein